MDKWNKDLNESIKNNNLGALYFLLKNKDKGTIVSSNFLNLIIKHLASDYPSNKSHIYLPKSIKDLIENSIQNLEIKLSDFEFRQLMNIGGFANIFKTPYEDFTHNLYPKTWNFNNVQEFLLNKLSDSKCINATIYEIFYKKEDSDLYNRCLLGAYEVLRFTPEDKKQYAWDLISQKLEENNLSKPSYYSVQKLNSLWELLAVSIKYNLQNENSFWNNIGHSITEWIENPCSSTNPESILAINSLSFSINNNIDILGSLNIQYSEKLINNYFKAYSATILNKINQIKNNNIEKSKLIQLSSLFDKFENLIDLSKNLEKVEFLMEHQIESFYKNFSYLLIPQHIDFLEEEVFKIEPSPLHPIIIEQIQDNWGELKKIIIFNKLKVNKVKVMGNHQDKLDKIDMAKNKKFKI